MYWKGKVSECIVVEQILGLTTEYVVFKNENIWNQQFIVSSRIFLIKANSHFYPTLKKTYVCRKVATNRNKGLLENQTHYFREYYYEMSATAFRKYLCENIKKKFFPHKKYAFPFIPSRYWRVEGGGWGACSIRKANTPDHHRTRISPPPHPLPTPSPPPPSPINSPPGTPAGRMGKELYICTHKHQDMSCYTLQKLYTLSNKHRVWAVIHYRSSIHFLTNTGYELIYIYTADASYTF